MSWSVLFFFFFSSRRRHTRCALVTGVQTCALPICILHDAVYASSEHVAPYGSLPAARNRCDPRLDGYRRSERAIGAFCDLVAKDIPGPWQYRLTDTGHVIQADADAIWSRAPWRSPRPL